MRKNPASHQWGRPGNPFAVALLERESRKYFVLCACRPAESLYDSCHSVMWGGTVWAHFSAPVHVARHIGGLLAFARAPNGDVREWLGIGGIGFALKLLPWLADNCVVQRSALITGLSLALGAATLAGIGEWVVGRFDVAPEGGSSPTAASPGYGHYHVPPIPSTPEFPDTGDHLPATMPEYTFRHDVPEVRLQFTVADQQGRLISNLSADDVRVFDNQALVEHFNDFERDEDLPLQLGLVLDTSDSVRRVLPQEKSAATAFLTRVLRPQSDSAFVVGFAGDIQTWQRPTGNRQELMDAIARLKEPGWGTRVFDALYAACSDQVQQTIVHGARHRALIALTDGEDTDSLRTLDDVIARAERSEVQIYPLAIHPRRAPSRGDRLLQRLADSTGGRFYIAASSNELSAAFEQIERDLRTQYSVSFAPQQSSPGFHSLRVEVRAPERLEIHARQGYYALQP